MFSLDSEDEIQLWKILSSEVYREQQQESLGYLDTKMRISKALSEPVTPTNACELEANKLVVSFTDCSVCPFDIEKRQFLEPIWLRKESGGKVDIYNQPNCMVKELEQQVVYVGNENHSISVVDVRSNELKRQGC